MSSARLSAIEEKRAKLEELRRLRKTRIVSTSTSPPPPPPHNNNTKPHYVSVSVSTTDDYDNDNKRIDILTYDKGTQTVDEELEDLEPQQHGVTDTTIKHDTTSEDEDHSLLQEDVILKDNDVNKQEFDEEKLAEFVGKSLKIVDKSLANDANIDDYYHHDTIGAADDDYEHMQNPIIDPVIYHTTLKHEITGIKSITSLDWSPFNSNLLAASYATLPPHSINNNTTSTKDQNKSLIIIWNIKLARPEFFFTSTTEILTVKFALHKKTILFAGGYNGKILQYDITSDSKFPIAQSPLSSSLNTHSHPIYTILQTNTKTTTSAATASVGNIISCSTDGKICQWSPFLLDKPISNPLQLKTSISRYDEDLINSSLKLSNGSLLLGGSSLTLLENFQLKNNFKPFDVNFPRGGFVTGLSQFPDPNTNENLILCSTVDSIYLYNEQGTILRQFATSSIIMDIDWLNAETFIVATGQSLELFDLTRHTNYSIFESLSNEYINKVKANDSLIAAGTENGDLLLYKYVK